VTHGEGSIFKTKDAGGRTKWKVEVTVGHHPDGSRKRTRRTAKSHAEALKIRRELVADRDEYQLNFENPTLDTFALWWIRDVQALRVKPATAADYEHRYRKIISPTFGHMTLADIGPHEISMWVRNLRHDYADASVNGALRVYKMVLGAAVDHNYLRSNAASRIPGISSRENLASANPPWDANEARTAVESAKGHPFGIPVLLALHYGLRKGEILGLKWGDIDFEEGLLHIRRARREYLAYNPDGSTRFEEAETEPKTRASKRTLHIGDFMLEPLLTEASRVFGGPFTTDDAHVVSDPSTGTPMNTKRFTKSFADFLCANNLRKVRFHDLRHSAAQSALAAGVRIESVSQSLGHSRIDITKAVYAPSVQPLSNEFGTMMQKFLTPE
jgi:integrase